MKEIKVVAAVFVDASKILLARRKEGKSLAGHWEFPGGKIEEGEAPEHALQREIEEELGVNCEVGDFITTVIHDYPRFRIHLSAYYCKTDDLIHTSTDHDKFAWVSPQDYPGYQIAHADIPILKKLIELS